ncbi:hypothetical protein BLNAU_10787 [Blattamonas nauphoetae]|uniref:Ubiquitin-like domain-containing protein n=1 Tax=Blattamonas nauphoetae TaxID=2049346 RepID=A0ABQ9XRV9_9EUKA|nr:hypothetical protein BLNAU_10787 [Blattamonas nauphoetae]
MVLLKIHTTGQPLKIVVIKGDETFEANRKTIEQKLGLPTSEGMVLHVENEDGSRGRLLDWSSDTPDSVGITKAGTKLVLVQQSNPDAPPPTDNTEQPTQPSVVSQPHIEPLTPSHVQDNPPSESESQRRRQQEPPVITELHPVPPHDQISLSDHIQSPKIAQSLKETIRQEQKDITVTTDRKSPNIPSPSQFPSNNLSDTLDEPLQHTQQIPPSKLSEKHVDINISPTPKEQTDSESKHTPDSLSRFDSQKQAAPKSGRTAKRKETIPQKDITSQKSGKSKIDTLSSSAKSSKRKRVTHKPSRNQGLSDDSSDMCSAQLVPTPISIGTPIRTCSHFSKKYFFHSIN